MLSDTSLPVIKAILPVVGENIHEIARRFYTHMFEGRPELFDGLFNRGNQAEGYQQQALAESIAAFATSLVNDPDDLPDQSAQTSGSQAHFVRGVAEPIRHCS